MFYVPCTLEETTFLWKLTHLRYMKKADKKDFCAAKLLYPVFLSFLHTLRFSKKQLQIPRRFFEMFEKKACDSS